jgi:MinD-like ATPase involved in chromosome partitioning or flagellar assembly
MYTICWSPKGGSGTTVVSAALALATDTALLVDLAGDLPAAIGVSVGTEGVYDWLRSGTTPSRLDDLTTEIHEGHHLIAAGTHGAVPARRWSVLADHLSALDGIDVVIDAGTTPRPPKALFERADRRLLVLRPCYLGLRRASEAAVAADGVVLIVEPGRALSATDIERCLQVPVLAEVTTDPSVARAVDAGLLSSRAPRSLAPITRLARP